MVESLWVDDGNGPVQNPDLTQEDFDARFLIYTREVAKAQRQATVEAIKVTTATGKTFDGDETSQGRMARAIIGMQASGQPAIAWVLADNTPTEATLAELTEAMCLAGQAQAAVWVI